MYIPPKDKRQFVAYFYFVGWSNISAGISISLYQPNVEIHIPFGFFRMGFVKHRGRPNDKNMINFDYCTKRTFGYAEKYF